MASVYSGAGEGRYGTVQVKGMVEFGMQYNYKQGALEIHVKQCKELAAVDTKRNRSDPYVKVSDSNWNHCKMLTIEWCCFDRFISCPTRRRVESERPKWRSTRSIPFSMKFCDFTCRWVASSQEHFGSVCGRATCKFNSSLVECCVIGSSSVNKLIYLHNLTSFQVRKKRFSRWSDDKSSK